MTSDPGSSSDQSSTVILQSPIFLKNIQQFVKKNYRRDKQNLSKFQELLLNELELMREVPRGGHGKMEPAPHQSIDEGQELWKVRFKIPGHRGAREQCRIIYIYHPVEDWILPLIIYTHAEFAGRPPDKQLAQLIKDVDGWFKEREEDVQESQEDGSQEND